MPRALSWAGGDLAGYLLLYKMIHDMPSLLDVHANDTALTPLRQERGHVWNEPSNIFNTMGEYPLGSFGYNSHWIWTVPVSYTHLTLPTN